MTVKTGTAWAGTFVTLDATGALATPSAGPAGVLYIDGTADAAAVTISGANPYKWAVTLPALTAGQRVDMYITATIATIATAWFVASDQADTVLVSEVKAETALILADTGTDGVVLASGAITAAVIATDAIDADSIKADAVTKIQAGLSTLGAGGTSKVYTVTDSVSGLPIADVHVWVSTDTAGANVIASGYTDVSGQVTFMLDAATYYIWRMKAGYNFTNPDTEVVA